MCAYMEGMAVKIAMEVKSMAVEIVMKAENMPHHNSHTFQKRTHR